MDVHCLCGYHGHIDEDFVYFYKCPACEEVFAVGCTVKLYRLSAEEDKKHRKGAKTPLDYIEKSLTE